MDGERGKNIAVGLTTLIGVVGLLALLALFGGIAPVFRDKGYVVQVSLNKAGGLSEGSAVTYNDIPVGKVERIALGSLQRPGVVVTARIRNEVDLPVNVSAQVGSASLLGSGALLMLAVPTGEKPSTEPLARDGEAVLAGRVQSLSSVFDSFEAISQTVQGLSGEIETLAQEWQTVGRNLALLTEPRAPGDVDSGLSLGNLASVVARADTRLKEMQAIVVRAESVMASVEEVVGDEQLRADIRATASGARELTEASTKAVEEARVALVELQTRYVALADDLSASVMEAQALLNEVREGEGTLGQMVANPSLYKNLDDTVIRMQKTLDEARLLVEKWKKEGLPIQF